MKHVLITDRNADGHMVVLYLSHIVAVVDGGTYTAVYTKGGLVWETSEAFTRVLDRIHNVATG